MTAILSTGAPPGSARAAVVMLHGRGASAQDILSLTGVFQQPDLHYLAPQAPGAAWYPRAFLAPIEENEPYLSASLATIGAILAQLQTQGFAPERVALLGFSQGGCLGLEYAARNARRYGGLVGLSAGLIGPPGTTWDNGGSQDHDDFGSNRSKIMNVIDSNILEHDVARKPLHTFRHHALANTPVFIGCGDADGHIPVWRVRESEAALRKLGGDVTATIYPGMGHTINDDEIRQVRALLSGLGAKTENTP